MATICKIEKMVRVDGDGPVKYPMILVWAILDDCGKIIFETAGIRDSHFRECCDWLKLNPQPIIKCLACEG